MLPLNRHSTLPELKAFVGLFKPRTIYPNTIYDQKHFLDYFMLHRSFADVIADEGKNEIIESANRMAQNYRTTSGQSKANMRGGQLVSTAFTAADLASVQFGVEEPDLKLTDPNQALREENGPLAFENNLSITCGQARYNTLAQKDLDQMDDDEKENENDDRDSSALESIDFSQPNLQCQPVLVQRSLKQLVSPVKKSRRESGHLDHTNDFFSTPPDAVDRPIPPPPHVLDSPFRIRPLPAAQPSLQFQGQPLHNPDHHPLCKCNKASWPEEGKRPLREHRKAVRKVQAIQQVFASQSNLAESIKTELIRQREQYKLLQMNDTGPLLASPAMGSWFEPPDRTSPDSLIWNRSRATLTATGIPPRSAFSPP